MKITTKDGIVFEGTQEEYEAFLAFAERQLAEQEAEKALVTPQTVDVYEKVETEYVPQEGDIVVVISNNYSSRNSVGDIGKITKVKSYGIDVEVPSKTSDSNSYGNCHAKDEVRKATPAEVEVYEKALHKASFNVGDYVKSVKSEFGREEQILKITDSGKGLRTRHASGEVVTADFLGKSLDGDIYGILAERIVKATEQEVENALEAVKWAKIGRKFGEFKVGDIIGYTLEKPTKYYRVTRIEGVKVYFNSTEFGNSEEFMEKYAKEIELIAPVESTFK